MIPRFFYTIADVGKVHNFISNSTHLYSNFSDDYQTFRIGRGDSNDPTPSMMWLEGGYPSNNYIYTGNFFICYNNNTIRFHSATTDDFTVTRNDPNSVAPFKVSFSMKDELAPDSLFVGVKMTCTVLAWPEPYRDDYLIYIYDLLNLSGEVLTGVYTVLEIDGDISSAGGGAKPDCVYYMDDKPNFYLGTDSNGKPEHLSYMWDADNPWIPGDDTGGRWIPKESLGFLGSRVLQCPARTGDTIGVTANTQSGHICWNWCCVPSLGREVYDLAARQEFRPEPSSPHDYRYAQTTGPFDIMDTETVRFTFALGIGEGLSGLRSVMQTAYDDYWNGFMGPSAPYISYHSPQEDSVLIYQGQTKEFQVNAYDRDGDAIKYIWIVNGHDSTLGESVFRFQANENSLDQTTLESVASDGQFSSSQRWQIQIRPPLKYELYQNFPNPFNGTTTIPFDVDRSSRIKIMIYNLRGQKVVTLVDRIMPMGKYSEIWDGHDLRGRPVASGCYLYELQSEKQSKIRKLLILR